MKLSNEKILGDSSHLSILSQKEFPVKVSYAIAKNLSKLEAELKTYNLEREKLIEKYSEKDSTGKTIIDPTTQQIKILDENLDEWNKDFKDLLAIENDVEIHKFSIEALNGQNISAGELMLIEYMIEED